VPGTFAWGDELPTTPDPTVSFDAAIGEFRIVVSADNASWAFVRATQCTTLKSVAHEGKDSFCSFSVIFTRDEVPEPDLMLVPGILVLLALVRRRRFGCRVR